tara:strand:- start:668 stop:877 length:210 start_codon:yes stop_codon:yes gene_type:complete
MLLLKKVKKGNQMDNKPLLIKAEVLSRESAKELVKSMVESSSNLSKEQAEENLWKATKASFSATFDFVE